MPVKVKKSTALPWLVRARPYLSLAALSPVNLLGDNLFQQFIGVRIISIVQQYFKVTITTQFESKILNVIQFVSKLLVTVSETKASELVPCSLLLHWNSMRFFATVSLSD